MRHGSSRTQGLSFVLRGKKLPVLGNDFPFLERLVKQARFGSSNVLAQPINHSRVREMTFLANHFRRDMS